MEFKKVYTKTKSDLDELYHQSALTVEGLVDADSTLNEFADWINEKCGATDITFHIILGKVMNDVYQLHGDNAYLDDLPIIAATGDLDLSKLAIPRFQLGARWFDDIVDNNAARELADDEDAYDDEEDDDRYYNDCYYDDEDDED